MPLWLAPFPNVVKLNVYAATSANTAFLAVVARDSSGSILNCWAKRSHSSVNGYFLQLYYLLAVLSADPMIQATIKDALYIMLLTYCN